MKWNNKGKEITDAAAHIVEEFKKRKGIYIFGAGILGEEMRLILEEYKIFLKYIDNDLEKQKVGHKSAEVISIENYLLDGNKGWVVVAASEKNTKIISEQLEEKGLKERIDFFCYQDFLSDVFPIISLYCYDKLFAEISQICLTERCTLKCRKCAHACHRVPKDRADMPLEIVKESADIFFKRFDMVKEFTLIGGEPFLYKDLKSSIEYIGENYRKKMMIFSITTNGTILPDDEILDLCKRYDISIRISDYSESLPSLKKQYDKVYKKVAQNKVIVWKTDHEKSWLDYGFGEIDRGTDENQLMEAFDKCRTPCREIRGYKYYYCVMARSVSENLGIDAGKQDYLDLRKTENRQEILEFQMGYSDKGYLDMCRFCRGAEAKGYLIPAAEQEEKRLE